MYNVLSPSMTHKNFSRAAGTYDRYADVQRQAAGELLLGAGSSARHIYEAGCGTGLYTRMLREKFPAARITAVDICAEMVREACRSVTDVSFLVADAQRHVPSCTFDLVTSNATLQWLNSEIALRLWRSLLSKGGTVLFSSFGPRTYEELNEVLGEHNLGMVAAHGFRGKQELLRDLEALFAAVSMREIIRHKSFARLEDLLAAVKFTGSRGQTKARNGLCTQYLLNKLDAAYRKRFGTIRATYQIFICEAR